MTPGALVTPPAPVIEMATVNALDGTDDNDVACASSTRERVCAKQELDNFIS